MRLLPSIFKYYEAPGHVEEYQFSSEIFEQLEEEEEPLELEEGEEEESLEFEEDREEGEQQEQQDEETEEEKEDASLMTEKEREAILDEANRQAKEIIANAEIEAERLQKEAYTAGYDQGSKEGYEAAYEEQQQLLEEETNQFLGELQAIITETEQKKADLLQKYRKDMKNIAIAVGEKVIQISLKSSGGVIERMIESATEKLKRREWMKIYIAKCDADLLVEGDSQLMKNLNHISKHVKLIVMENETPGTCIIELPDEIIDASATTQVENIKEILNNASI